MDLTEQVYRSDVSGWRRGLYEDITETMGFVGSPFRILLYHEPRFVRYMWGQLKPIVQTREFAAFVSTWRDTLISALEPELPRYGPNEVGLAPSEFTELQAQFARFDIAGPRYQTVFEIVDRQLNGRDVDTNEEMTEATTAPCPPSFDRNRGNVPTFLPMDEARDVLQRTVPAEQRDNFGEMVPSGWRCFAQWPEYLEQAWTELETLVNSDAFESACEESLSLVDTYIDRVPYTPAVGPRPLSTMGFTEETITELQAFFAAYKDSAQDFIPLLPTHAATVDAAGERNALTFP